ncbi:BON domain-containing protein [Herbaspirillum seropedicae]|uniref:Hemolysin protein n=1 Tax=Herbaspirillum seropedicae (strain SmR1) TaxID=757424 RepID=D8IY16_HERSS|nr:BON domain-containing protein [Herbaspirillum seropedicae]ADJ66138.1 hemolysin protein [Herbaspirillum seropedicae SmR1]AKN67895.1 transporter [Herbaspirillum seropedicae]NQE29928.1 transporter [Herbaspirillum seropedicae]UMU23933.1 BON domain-containing protein [Herbaspirillum seropedicae]
MNEAPSLLTTLRRPLAAVALGGMLALSLQGCFAVFAGGALATTFAATDRRTLGAQTEDKAIVVKGESRLPEVLPAGSHVNVTAFNRKVLLSGEVPDEAAKATAERETRAIQNVETVYNELAVMPASSFGSRSNDALITSKVLASLVDDKTLYSSAFKITTERGIVYMMGRVTQREGQRAAQIASGVSDVTKVVTLFEYISEDELKDYQRKPASENKATS